MNEPKLLRLTAYEYKCWDEWKYNGKITPGRRVAAVRRAQNKMRRMGLPESVVTGANDD